MIKPMLKTSKLKDSPPFEFDMKFPIFKSNEKIYIITPGNVKKSLLKSLTSLGKDPKFFLFASGFISGVMFDRIVFGK